MPYDPSAVRSGSVFSDNPNYLGSWLCYINGLEVPCVGFSVSSGVWQIPQFDIYLHPDVSIIRLGHEDRVIVQLFYLDHWYSKEFPEFRLLADGEITGWRYKTAHGQRVMSFSCVGHITLFEMLYFFFMNTLDDIVSAQSPAVRAQGYTQPGLFYPYSLFHQGLFASAHTGAVSNRFAELERGQTASQNVNDQTGAMVQCAFEIIYNVIKGIIASEPIVPDENRTLPMLNFFARRTRITRLHQRFVRLPILEDPENLANRQGVFPIFNAVRSDEALMALQRQVSGRIGNSGSIWEVIKQIFSMVMMEVAMIPNPTCVKTTLEGKILGPLHPDEPLVNANDIQNPVHVPAPSPSQPDSQTLPQRVSHEPEAVIYYNMFDDFWYEVILANPDANFDHYRDMYERVDTGAVHPSNYAAESDSFLSRIQTHDPSAYTACLTIRDRYAEAYGNRTADEISIQNRTLPPSSRRPGTRPPASVREQEQSAHPPVPDPSTTNRPAPLMCVNPQTPVRLAQYFVKPAFLFGLPPQCNVFYPSMLDDWNGSEDYSKQPTRIYVNDSVMTRLMNAQTSANREFMQHALTVGYPEEADAVMSHRVEGSQQGVHETGKDLLIWPEEFYKGPVTARMELPSWFQMLVQFRNSQGEARAGANASPTGTSNAGGATSHDPIQMFTAPTTSSQLVPRRGLVFTTQQDDPDPWVLPDSLIELGESLPRIQYDANGGYSRRRINADGTHTVLPHEEVIYVSADEYISGINFNIPPLAPIRALMEDIYRRFPGTGKWINHHLVRDLGYNRTGDFSDNINDVHRWGRACDIMIPTVNHRADHTIGDRIANYLVENAAIFGISYIVWASVSWAGDWPARTSRPARHHRHQPYTMVRLDDNSKRHRNHIHVDINIAASLARYPWYQQQGIAAIPGRIPNFRETVRRSQGASVVAPHILNDAEAPITTVSRQVQVQVTTTISTPPGSTATPTSTPLNPGEHAPSSTSNQVTTSSPTPPTVTTTEPTADAKFQDLFRLYAQYEFLRQRYSLRQGAISCKFNPYVVAGFPAMIFDRLTTSIHAVAYVVGVTHNGMSDTGGGSMGTQVTFTCLRTLPEYLNDVRNDINRFNEPQIFAAPAEMIQEIRQVIQHEDQAETFYQKLFYGEARPGNLPAAFHLFRVMGYSRGLDAEQITVQQTETAVSTSGGDQSGSNETSAQGNQPHVDEVTGTATLPPLTLDLSNIFNTEGAGIPLGSDTTWTVHTNRTEVLAVANEPRGDRYTWSTLPGNIMDLCINIIGNRQRAIREDPRHFEGRNPYRNHMNDLEDELTRLVSAEIEQSNQNHQSTPRPVRTVNQTVTRATTHNINPNLPLTPLPGTVYFEMFDNYDLAMQMAARNICTLTEFIRFWHSGRTIGDLIGSRDIESEEDSFRYHSLVEQDVVALRASSDGQRQNIVGMSQRYSAVYYKRIFRLRQGPGAPPTEAERGYTSGETTVSPSRAGVDKDYPETRVDWDTVLEAYRLKSRTRHTPST